MRATPTRSRSPESPVTIAGIRTKVQKAQPKAPRAVIVGEPDQPLGNLLVVRVVLGPIAVARLADPEDLTGQG